MMRPNSSSHLSTVVVRSQTRIRPAPNLSFDRNNDFGFDAFIYLGSSRRRLTLHIQ